VTVYDARRAGRYLRPTLRLRLTLLNAVLLVSTALLFVLLAYLLLRGALDADMRSKLLLRGLIAVLIVGVVGIVGGWALAGRALRPLQQVTAAARHLSGETLDQRLHYVGADD